MRFRRSRLYISAFAPAAVGFAVGFLSAIMGVGGGFVMVPAMIYLLGMPSSVVVGTSLFQITFVSANVTILQAAANRSEEHTSELQSLMRIPYAVFCCTNKNAE